MRILRRATWGSRKVTSMSLGAPNPFSNSQRTLQNSETCVKQQQFHCLSVVRHYVLQID